MQCSACGKHIADSAYACVYCGASVRERTSPRPTLDEALSRIGKRTLSLDDSVDPDATLVLSRATRTPQADPDETLFSPAERSVAHETPVTTALAGELDEDEVEDETGSASEAAVGEFPSARSSPPMRLIAAIVVVAMISAGGLWSLLSRLTGPTAAPAERVAMADPHPPQADTRPAAPPRSSASTEFAAPVSTDPLAGGAAAGKGPETGSKADDPTGSAAALSARAAAARSDTATLGGAPRRSRTSTPPTLAAAAGPHESAEARTNEGASGEPRSPSAAPATGDKGSKTLDELLK